MGVKGVALGTVTAEVVAAAVGLAIAARHLHGLGGHWDFARLAASDRIGRTLAVNRDIMIRSAALIVVFAWFISQGAKQGDAILAANAVLMHLITVAAYFLDGLAFAAEALVGKAVGAASRAGLFVAARLTTGWAAGFALLACASFALLGTAVIDTLTVDPNVRELARTYLPWATFTPLAAVWCFQLDGIFIGATCTAQMRNAMLMSLAIFLVAWWALAPLGNNGLWASLLIHYAARTATLLYYFPTLVRSVPA
jgi:MATE family multidrug resistance protein